MERDFVSAQTPKCVKCSALRCQQSAVRCTAKTATEQGEIWQLVSPLKCTRWLCPGSSWHQQALMFDPLAEMDKVD
eukprot:647202-Amphidinium_carterae.1